jgi:hypothetical protein
MIPFIPLTLQGNANKTKADTIIFNNLAKKSSPILNEIPMRLRLVFIRFCNCLMLL